MKPTVLITGAAGLIGGYLVRSAARWAPQWKVCGLSRAEADLTDRDQVKAVWQRCRPSLVIHCGDIVTPGVLEALRDLPMRFVYGNNDIDRASLQKKCTELGFGTIDDELILTVEGKSLYVYHGTRAALVEAKADSQEYDYVLHGHTHRRRNERIGNTRVVNPGAMFNASLYSFATIDLNTNDVEFHDVPR